MDFLIAKYHTILNLQNCMMSKTLSLVLKKLKNIIPFTLKFTLYMVIDDYNTSKPSPKHVEYEKIHF